MFTKKQKFIFAIAVQLIIIFAIIIFKVAILTGGTDVLLKIEPIDPRDPFRGDYVTFNYSISNVNSYGMEEVKNGDTVYVSLREFDEYWSETYVSLSKPQRGVFIKGKVVEGGEKSQMEAGSIVPGWGGSSNLRITYGIEEYFIPEGKGQGFSFWDKESSARVAIDENGNAVLKQIYVDDKPWP